MSFKTLNIGATALITSQAALNTVGHNVANAATPGYTRQRVITEANLPDIKTFGAIGSGVNVESIRRISDNFLEMQVREARTLFNYLDTQINTYENIEGVVNELTDNDLSSAFDGFWNSLSDVNNLVEDVSTRRALIEQGTVLAETFNNLDSKLANMREQMDSNVVGTVSKVNTLVEEISRLNQDIVRAEKGGLSEAMANDSRDMRDERLKALAEIMDVTVTEESSGQVVVTYRGRLMVFENQHFGLTTENNFDEDMLIHDVAFAADGEELEPDNGRLGAFMELRDTIIPSYRDDFDELAGNFIWEFNKIHSSGQGLNGYETLESGNTVLDPLVSLDEIAYEFTPKGDTFKVENGNMELQVRNEVTGEVTKLNIEIDLDNTGEPDTILYHNTAVDRYDSLDKFNLTGLDYANNTGPRGELYFEVVDTGPGGPYDVNAYSDNTLTTMVATGTIGATTGTVTLNQVAGSGISGTVELNYSNDDSTIVVPDLFNNSFVSKVQNALDDILPGSFSVTVDTANRVTIDSNSADYTFGFGRDTSGVLAALGLNTFFDGYDASSIAVDSRIRANPDKVAGSTMFEDGDNSNIVNLLAMREANVYENNSSTVDDFYQSIVGRLGVEFDQKNSLRESQEDILMRAENQRESLSGVNIDEELTLMIQFQRSFQSAARFITTANSMYESLIQM